MHPAATQLFCDYYYYYYAAVIPNQHALAIKLIPFKIIQTRFYTCTYSKDNQHATTPSYSQKKVKFLGVIGLKINAFIVYKEVNSNTLVIYLLIESKIRT